MPDQTLAEALQQIAADLFKNLDDDDPGVVNGEEIAKALDASTKIGIKMGRYAERNRTQLLLKAQFFDG